MFVEVSWKRGCLKNDKFIGIISCILHTLCSMSARTSLSQSKPLYATLNLSSFIKFEETVSACLGVDTALVVLYLALTEV